MTPEPVPQTAPQPTRPLRQRILGYVVLVALPILFAYLGITVVLAALPLKFGPLLVFSLAIAAILFLLAALLVVFPIRRKLRTGKFLFTPAESAAYLRESRAKYGAGKPAAPQLWLWLIPSIFSLILVSAGSVVISVAWCGCEGHLSAADRIGVLVGVGIVVIGFVYPFLAIRRKLRTGYFLPSSEELAARRAKCAKPKPLRTRILLAAAWCFPAILWTATAVEHLRRPHGDNVLPWFTASIMWLNVVLWTWQIFRPRASQCALPLDDAPLAAPADDGPRFTMLD
jgi:hypothetical protein